jgi:hypothetical protein
VCGDCLIDLTGKWSTLQSKGSYLGVLYFVKRNGFFVGSSNQAS